MTDYAGQAPQQRQYRDVPEPHAGTKSIGEALGDVTTDLSVLFQQEVALAKAEVGQTVNRASQAAGILPAPRSPRSCSCSSCRWPSGRH
jgi:hypothetical protein